MKYVYGVVPSRRLGNSLGVNLTPFKTCSFSCVYCQLGRTTCKTVERKSFFPKREVLKEVFKALEKESKAKNININIPNKVDYVTFAGEGEPTLNSDIGWLIDKIKEANVKVAVITNSSLLFREDVRNDLMSADVILPSLDAATQTVFRRINRPHETLSISEITEGLKTFCKEFKGKIMLEIMLVKNYNNSDSELKTLANIIKKLKLDCVHLLTPIRPPASKIEPVNSEDIMKAIEIFEGLNVKDVILPENGNFDFSIFKSLEEAVNIMSRHPMRKEQVIKMAKFFGKTLKDVEEIDGIIKKKFMNNTFYMYASKYKN